MAPYYHFITICYLSFFLISLKQIEQSVCLNLNYELILNVISEYWYTYVPIL